ncbi:hypothetical protein INT44_001006 [Umbelopsis vinacea]|uniref:DUF1479-domain-containing protein n=1 Tax=Umbelopsis vinacea TaxID=44442 RepID=A0A8H7Q9C9_9FUNG|nr:hypothetical protein INT44_001006 [Umbelopsis vinacea]
MFAAKKSGDIFSAFAFGVKDELPARYKTLKDQLRTKDIQQAWGRLLASYEKESERIQALGSKAVTEVDFKDIQANNGRFPEETIKELRKSGCVVVRGVYEREEALGYKQQVLDYIAKHPGIDGFPAKNPQIWELYWTKGQAKARSHPNFLTVSTALNQIWHASDEAAIDLSTNVTYCDRLRLRESGDKSFNLSEHVDGGSVERWEDPEYRKCYQKILDGNWEEYDPFDATHRVDATMDMYDCGGGCSMFRSFQGWVSLSDVQSPGGGTLKVCPLIKETTSYIMMRPLLDDLKDSSDMGGSRPGSQQLLTEEQHPHIIKTLVSIPSVHPGDCVFWSADTVHAVENECNNPTDSSVFYIPVAPLCAINSKCLRRQRDNFEKGLTPPDFPGNNCEVDFEDRAKPQDLSDLGKLGMGYTRFEENDNMTKGQREAIRTANSHLFD